MRKTKDDSAALAKRQWPRFAPESIPFLKGIALNQGNTARVVDISRGGALIETDVCLRPQMKLALKILTTKGTFRITSSVLRSSIKSLQGTPIYQGAIIFEKPLTMLDELEPVATEVEQSGIYTEAEKKIGIKEFSVVEPVMEINTFTPDTSGAIAQAAQVLPAEQEPTPEVPDVFKSGITDSPPAPVIYRPDFQGKSVSSIDDEFIVNVIKQDGLDISFDNSDGSNDW